MGVASSPTATSRRFTAGASASKQWEPQSVLTTDAPIAAQCLGAVVSCIMWLPSATARSQEAQALNVAGALMCGACRKMNYMLHARVFLRKSHHTGVQSWWRSSCSSTVRTAITVELLSITRPVVVVRPQTSMCDRHRREVPQRVGQDIGNLTAAQRRRPQASLR